MVSLRRILSALVVSLEKLNASFALLRDAAWRLRSAFLGAGSRVYRSDDLHERISNRTLLVTRQKIKYNHVTHSWGSEPWSILVNSPGNLQVKGPKQVDSINNLHRMDFEELLYDLTPLLNPDLKTLSKNEDFHQKVLKKLDELAVSLRTPSNREVVRESGLLKQLCNINYVNGGIDIFSEVLRCLANAVADDDKNVKVVTQNTSFIFTIISIIENLDSATDVNRNFEIGKRACILVRNLFIEHIPQEKEVLESFSAGFMSFILKNFQNIVAHPEDSYLADITKIVLDLLSLFLDDPNIYTEKEFYQRSIPPFPQLLTLLEMYSKRVSTMSNVFKEDEQEIEDESEEEYEEPNDLTSLIFVSEIVEKLLKKSIQLKEEDPSLNGLKLLLSSLNILENCNFQFPSKLILLRRISFIIQCVTSDLSLDLPQDDFRCNLSFDISIYSFESIFALFEIIARDDSTKRYQISVLSFILSNMLDEKVTLKKWQAIYPISNYIKLVYENYKFADPYLYIPILDLLRKSISIVNFVEDASVLELFWRLANDHIVERLDLIQDLSRFYKLLMNKLLAVEYGQILYDSNILKYENLYSKNYAIIILLISKLSKYLLGADQNERLLAMIDKALEGILGEKESFLNILPEFFKALGVYIREYSLANYNDLPFYLSQNRPKFIQLLSTLIDEKSNLSPASKNNLKFCIGMVLSNKNIANKFEQEDLLLLKEWFAEL